MRKRLVGAFVFLFLVVFAGLYYINFLRAIQRPVRIALDIATNSEVVSTDLGTSGLKETFVTGRVISGLDSGNADLTIYGSGSKNRGTLEEWAQNSYAGWHICSLIFRDNRNRETTLVDDSGTHCERE
jgi:hypothetical protein